MVTTPNSNNHNRKQPPPNSTAVRAGTLYVKQENARYHPSIDDCSKPRTPLEQTIMSELQQMGFTDKKEILSSIRRTIEQNNSSTSTSTSTTTTITPDEIMMDIVTQREEADEARKMDEARMLSEEARKEEARQLELIRQQEAQERMTSATVEQWVSDSTFFPNSWILQHDHVKAKIKRLQQQHQQQYQQQQKQKQQQQQQSSSSSKSSSSTIQHQLVQLLQVEKKAFKWYGTVLPRSYFGTIVTQRLFSEDCSDDQFLSALERELEILQKVMYELSEQVGGVPRVFQQAHDEHVQKRSYTNNNHKDDGVVVVLAPAAAAASSSSNNHPAGSTAQIIEIL